MKKQSGHVTCATYYMLLANCTVTVLNMANRFSNHQTGTLKFYRKPTYEFLIQLDFSPGHLSCSASDVSLYSEAHTTLMFCASTFALASSSRLMTVVLPASTAQCSAVFLWYLSPRFTDTLKVSSSRVGSTLSHRGIISGQTTYKATCHTEQRRWFGKNV